MTIQATSVFRVRKLGSNTNGGGYDAAMSGAGTDYSQQDAAQATGTHGTAAGTTTFTDTVAAAFTAAMIGNAIYISGTGFTAGVYFVTARASSTSITLDRSPGTGTVGAWAIGGAWADPWTNIAATVVPGNKIYVRGSGTDAPTVDDYTHGAGASVTIPNGDFSIGNIQFIAENGRPQISSSTILYVLGTLNKFSGMYIKATAATAGSTGIFQGGNSSTTYYTDMVFDQAGYDVTMVNTPTAMIGGEVFSSVAPGSNGSNFALFGVQEATLMVGVNVHDTVGPGVRSMGRLGNHIRYNIFAKCRGDGLTLENSNGSDAGGSAFYGNTFDANLGHGLVVGGAAALQQSSVFNNIFSNHTGVGKYAIYANFGTTAANDRIKGYFDYNNFYGNTNDLFGISHSANDTALDPQYTAQATEGYNVGTNLKAKGAPQTAFPNSASSFTPTATQAYVDIGGVQRQEATSTDVNCSLGAITQAGLPASIAVSCILAVTTLAGLAASVTQPTTVHASLGSLLLSGQNLPLGIFKFNRYYRWRGRG